MTYYDYFIRCREQDTPAFLALGQAIGIIKEDPDAPGTHITTDPAWVWVPIGAIYSEAGEPRTAPDGSVYWHANLRLTINLLDHARSVYAANPTPELAAGLASIGSYFVVDANGRATRPANPTVVFA